MTNVEAALSAFKAGKWAEAIAAARQTDLSNAEILAWMGYCYRYGNGVSRDFVQAFTWFKKSAEGGYSWSMGELGHCYYYGRGTAKNYSLALAWYRKGAECGNAASQTGMGRLYEFGRGVEKNASQAFQWYKKAAENGDAEGMEELGECYEMAFGVEMNLVEAFKWYSKSAESGNSEGQYHVGLLCEFGKGTQKDVAKAFSWYKKSAEQGNARSQNRLGRCYEFGKGTEKNLAEAFKWYLKSAESCFPPGQFNAGDMYEYGKGTEKDIAKAFYWYKKSAENGDAAGQNRLGLCYELGKGTTKSFSEAVKWYLKSAENGNPNGQFNAGDMYENGKGVERDYAKALSWYKKAAEQGHPGAMVALGRFYENGYGVKKDLAEAKKWYQKAKDAGDDDADDLLKSLEEKMKPAPGTKVTQTSDGDRAATVEDILKELDALTGLKPVKDEVRKLIDFVKVQNIKASKGFKTTAPSNHIVFTGNPGTGKTTVARIISKVFKALGILKTDRLVETDRSGLVAKYIGQTAIKTNAVIDSALDGVLFIDEAYSLAQGGEEDFGQEAVDALLKRMEDDRDRLVVIVAGYTNEMKKFLKMNPGLQSRFTRYIDFPDYSADELTTIFKAMAEKNGCKPTGDVLKIVHEGMEYELAKRMDTFANARFVRTYFEKTLEKQAGRIGRMQNPGEKDLQTILPEDLPTQSALDGETSEKIEDILKELDELTGIEPVKKEIRKLAEVFKFQKQRKAQGLAVTSASYHCVFTGNPGTGKTTVARYMARIYKALGIIKTSNLVEADQSKLLGQYQGETPLKTNAIINEALNGVLFIDEAYTLAKGHEKDVVGKEAVDTLLKRMEDDRDRLVVIVAGYTNEMEKFINMNPGLKSRFTRYINFPDYSADELTEIFRNLAEKNQYTVDGNMLAAVRDRMALELKSQQEGFGNARFVRTLFEATMENKAARMAGIENPSPADLQELTVDDLPGGSAPVGKDESIDDVLKELDELVGIKPVKDEIRKLVSYFKLQKRRKTMGLTVTPASYHCVFSGSPGTGKTTVARIMARAYKALGVIKTDTLVEADRSKLVAEYIGQTAVKTNAIIDEALNGVLFIDEAYTLANGGEKDFGHEAVDTLLKRMEDDRDKLVVIIAGYTDEMHKFIDMNPGLQSRFTRYIEFPDYSADELAEIFARMAKKELYRFGEEVVRLVQEEMHALVANKTKAFGNARVARTFYEQVKERQAMRLAKVDEPTKEQMTELLPVDISDDASNSEGTNPYDIIGEAAELETAKGLFAPIMVNNRSIVKHCAYQVGELLVNDLIEDKGLAGQYQMMIRADITAALHTGIGAATEYRLHPAELNPETVYNMMMRAGGLCKVGEIGVSKLGAFATNEVRARLSRFDLAFQSLAIEVAKRDGQYYDPKKMPKDQTDAFCRLLHREAYAAFLTGFAIGTYLSQEGTQEVVKNGISVQIDYTHHLNLALAQNLRPLISNLRIKNKTRDTLKKCECRISCPEKFLLEYTQDLGDLWEDKEIDTGAIQIRFNVETLRRVASVQTGYLRVEVLSEGRMLFKHDYRVEAVAPDHSHNILRQPDMLAAYVIPHCEVVLQMQSDAATLLGQGTGNPSLNGYQGDRERVGYICRAIFEAIRRKYIRYAECPANFGLPGQKIRLPNEIMKYKLATCLDSTLLFASIAETCNLNPVIVLIQGHAFVGVFLEDKHLPQVSVDKAGILKKFCRDNAMIMIETTAVCHNISFEAAVDEGMKKLFTLEDDDFEYGIDVKFARMNGVKQLSLGDDMPCVTTQPSVQPAPTQPTVTPAPRTPSQPPPLVLVADPVQMNLFDAAKQTAAKPSVPVAAPTPVSQPAAPTGGNYLDEAHISALKKPSTLMFDGSKVANVGTWKELFQKLFEKLNDLDPAKFDVLPQDGQFSKYFIHLEAGKKTPHDHFKSKLGSDGNVRAKELANKIYLWRTEYYFRQLLNRLGVEANRIEVI